MNNYKKEICQLVGNTISYRRILGNSLVLYTNGKPGDITVKSLWIDPIWRLESKSKYIVGSDDFPLDDEISKDFSKAFKSACRKTDGLLHSRVKNISFDRTNDICIEFDNKQLLRTFVCGIEDEIWTYRNVKEKYQILGFYDRIEKMISPKKI